MSNHYEVPSWAGKPPVGLHLDVLKGDKLIQKLMIDEKKCYLFGRNPQINDFCIDHASCSRVHAALVYHKHLNRAFLVDLGSTHGTFIGRVQLESRKPTQLPVDSVFHFGASTRNYILRERPQKVGGGRGLEDSSKGEEVDGGLLGLPEAENDLDNLTEFNTAQNRRISMLTIPDEEIKVPGQRRRSRIGLSVRFNDEEEIINPEDIDPSIGKFRNLVQTAIIPNKKQKLDTNNPFGSGLSEPSASATNIASAAAVAQKHHNMAAGGGGHHHITSLFSPSLSTKLGLHLPNPAPDIDLAPPTAPIQTTLPLANRTATTAQPDMEPEPRKKKYAKEAWPGKKAIPSFLV